jgi:hypothetical protein
MGSAADKVMDLIFGRWRSQTLYAGTELGVFDHLDLTRATKADTLAARGHGHLMCALLQAHPHLSGIVLRCAALNLSITMWGPQ